MILESIEDIRQHKQKSSKGSSYETTEKAYIEKGAGENMYADMSVTPNNDLFKAYIPNFLYKPPFGYPRKDLDIFKVKQLANTPYVFGVIKSIKDRVSAIDWDIKLKKGVESTDELEKKRKEIVDKINIVNGNQESFHDLQRAIVQDMLISDSGVAVKVFNAKQEYQQMFARAGETFLKNPDIHGYIGDRENIIEPIQTDITRDTPGTRTIYNAEYSQKAAYFQYGWTPGSLPVPFGKREIIYFMLNPRTDSVYGRSPVQVLYETVLTLLYGGRYNLDSYVNNNVPQGMVQLLNANEKQIKAFRQRLNNKLLEQDEYDNYRNKGYYVPIVNTEAKYIPWQMSSKDMEVLEKQKWYQKLVWQCFGVNANEMGETEDSNKATDIGQARIIRKRAIQPILKVLQFGWNTKIMPELDSDGNFEFEYNNYDIEEDFRKNELYEKKLQYMTINEIRELEELDPVEDGDKIQGTGSNPFEGFGHDEQNQDNDKDKQDTSSEERDDLGKKSNAYLGQGFESKTNAPANDSELEKKLAKFYKDLEKKIKESSKNIDW